ncbi:MAG: 30S ribosomal protein S21 [Bacteroidia bacterium]|nr:30S ribosomal protein S21 [Bacteroidia bacterium]
MLKINVKTGESIERVLKRYKRKVRKVKQLNQLRERKNYTKKSAKRRETIKKAMYKQEYLNNIDSE